MVRAPVRGKALSRNVRTQLSVLEVVEKSSTIVAAILIPLIIAFGGWFIQDKINSANNDLSYIKTNSEKEQFERQNSLEYVRIATAILGGEEAPLKLNNWAWDVLSQQSPVEIPEDTLDDFKRSGTTLSTGGNGLALLGSAQGFVVVVIRERTETVGSRSRTIGHYFATYKGKRIEGLEGMTIEAGGGGNNAVPRGSRIQSGVYPLRTHVGPYYQTLRFSQSTSPDARPRPGIGIDATGNRSGILILPASGTNPVGFGTVALAAESDALPSSVEYSDSRKHVIDLIDAMKANIKEFPTTDGSDIPDAWMVIIGEPPLFIEEQEVSTDFETTP